MPIIFFQLFLRDTHVFEAWIESRESVVKDDQMGDSINEVEELIRCHDDFLKTIDAQEDKLDPIKRFTMVSKTRNNGAVKCCINDVCVRGHRKWNLKGGVKISKE